MPGHRGIFLLGRSMCLHVCVCVCVRGRVGWDQGDGISKLQLENFLTSKETLKNLPRSPTSVLCPFRETHSDIFALNPVRCLLVFFPPFFGCVFYLADSSRDYLETWSLCLCMFVSVFPLMLLRCATAGPGTVPVDQVSLCLCLLLWLAWQKPINTTLQALPPSSSRPLWKKKKRIILAVPKYTRRYGSIWSFSSSFFSLSFVEIPCIPGGEELYN